MSNPPQPHGETIAVVGGGIAGMFCAYILALNQRTVHLFEATPRFGGRIRTVRLDQKNQAIDSAQFAMEKLEFHAEFGPMRVELEIQRLLHALLEHLDFKEAAEYESPTRSTLENFAAYTSPTSEHDPQYELEPVEVGKSPLQLLQLAIMRIVVRVDVPPEVSDFEKKRELLKQEVALAGGMGENPLPRFLAWVETLTARDRWSIQTSGTIGGIELYTIGFWNLLTDYLSHDATAKIRDIGTFYHLLGENPNAAEWIVWWLNGFSISGHLKGLSGGMETIVERLAVKLRETGRVHHHKPARVLGVACEGSRFKLTTNATGSGEMLVDRVVLALPRVPLESLILRSPELFADETRKSEVLQWVDTAVPFQLLKVFCVVKKRWWEEDVRANKFATRIPTRELHYWKGSTPGSTQGLIMIYTDRPAALFWANYVKSGMHDDVSWMSGESDPHRQKERLIKKLVQYIRANDQPDFSERDILWVGIRDWGREPYGGASHVWRPKRRYWLVMQKLAHLAAKNGAGIHVCGEAFSDYHGFIEGALRSSVYALSKILPGTDLNWLSALKLEPRHAQELREWIENLDRTTGTVFSKTSAKL